MRRQPFAHARGRPFQANGRRPARADPRTAHQDQLAHPVRPRGRQPDRRLKRQIHSDTGLRIETLHPVLTTSLPRKFKLLEERILEWCYVKNDLFNGQAGLQFSINSTKTAASTTCRVLLS